MPYAVSITEARGGGFNFWDSIMTGAYVSRTQLSNIPQKLVSCTFEKCTLSVADYNHATFVNSNLYECLVGSRGAYSFIGGSLERCVIDRDISGMTNVRARNTTFTEADVNGDIMGSDLRGAVFMGCRIRSCDIIQSLKGATFIKCTFDKVKIVEEGLTDFEIYDIISKNNDASGLITSIDRVHE